MSKETEVKILTPEKSVELSNDAFQRNSRAAWKPKRVRRFRVSSPQVGGNEAGEYLAVNEEEAWAMHCDANLKWPGGWRKHDATITEIAPAVEVPTVRRPAAPQVKPAKAKA